MAKWKLSRISFINEEHTLLEGEKIPVGRGLDNKIVFPSLTISRHHCIIEVHKDHLSVTDLKSSNGTYVGRQKIPQNVPFKAKDSDTIGFGWTTGVQSMELKEEDKYVFNLSKLSTVINRIKFQSDNECDPLEDVLMSLCHKTPSVKENSPILELKTNSKRKLDSNLDDFNIKHKKESKCPDDIEKENKQVVNNEVIINLLSDSENESHKLSKIESKCNFEPILENHSSNLVEERNIKSDVNMNTEYNAFNIKQEYLGYDDELIQVDSDSDVESEQWLLRLSQSSPGKPFIKINRESKSEMKPSDCSYSQVDDVIIGPLLEDIDEDNQEYIMNDIISIPQQSLNTEIINFDLVESHKTDKREYQQDIKNKTSIKVDALVSEDKIDGANSKNSESLNLLTVDSADPLIKTIDQSKSKQVQIIEPLKLVKSKAQWEIKLKESKSNKQSKSKSSSSSKIHLTNSQKEERKKKLKEIATKDREVNQDSNSTIANKTSISVKNTSTNRGAFLTEVVERTLKSDESTITTVTSENISEEIDVQSKKKHSVHSKSFKSEKKHKRNKHKSNDETLPVTQEARVPHKSLKPLSESENSISTKPFSKVKPLPPRKPVKKVTFADKSPQVHEFQIEPGNKLRKINLKATLVDARRIPMFSLEKIMLMKILRWNAPWLEEQLQLNDPPPILEHNPTAVLHNYESHKQYIRLFGDLVLMEVWECLTQGYVKERTEGGIPMAVELLPQIVSPDNFCDVYTMNVTVTLPQSTRNQKDNHKNLPRVSEILFVTFGPDQRMSRLFFVNNVRCLPSKTNSQTIFNISLQTIYTEKMSCLQLGQTIYAKRLAHINNELMLFEAMDHLAHSPLNEAVLRPKPHHFVNVSPHERPDIRCKWTNELNESQMLAVCSSVTAALSDQPSIQMVQGPPGTGKSSVICAIVMSYFYDSSGKRQQNRGKILICATSNPAVDELVVRLLKIRQSLPKSERFRMVRVGREESMHPLALDLSSQQLARRDVRRAKETPNPNQHHVTEEILLLEAKINMCTTAARDSKDAGRIAYYEGRVTQLNNRIALLRTGGSVGCRYDEDVRPDQFNSAEKRIIEGADIVVTTLSSVHNNKMKGLKRRIALCVVDEAGQATEPETLAPLTLGVTRLTLVGDPQQLTSFVCSQRAKTYGLGDSLFSRLSSCSEQWTGVSPVVLLNRQYRMHAHIADYPNKAFYDGRIQTHAPRRPDLRILPYVVLDICSGNKGQMSSGANEIEAWGVCRLVAALHHITRALNLSLAVITPYRGHKDLIKKILRNLLGESGDSGGGGVEVNTVDSFQGQERDVVVVSLARSSGVGFAAHAGRINVMLTRARHALLLCLNGDAIQKNNQWRSLVEDAQHRKVYRRLPNKVCQPTTQGQRTSEDILQYISYK